MLLYGTMTAPKRHAKAKRRMSAATSRGQRVRPRRLAATASMPGSMSRPTISTPAAASGRVTRPVPQASSRTGPARRGGHHFARSRRPDRCGRGPPGTPSRTASPAGSGPAVGPGRLAPIRRPAGQAGPRSCSRPPSGTPCRCGAWARRTWSSAASAPRPGPSRRSVPPTPGGAGRRPGPRPWSPPRRPGPIRAGRSGRASGSAASARSRRLESS